MGAKFIPSRPLSRIGYAPRDPEQELLSEIEKRRLAKEDQELRDNISSSVITSVGVLPGLSTLRAARMIPWGNVIRSVISGTRNPIAVTTGAGLGALTSEDKGQGAVSGALDTVLGLPGAAAFGVNNANAIITGAPQFAKTFGMEQFVRKLGALSTLGEPNHKIAQRTIEEFYKRSNPHGATSAYIGPDGIPRIVMSNKDAALSKSAPVSYGRDKADINLGEYESAPLNEFLNFPQLYELSPLARETKVRHNPYLTLFGEGKSLGYNPATNTIDTGAWLVNPSRLANDTKGNLLEGLLHESGHILQTEQGLRHGTGVSVDQLLKSIEDARAKGSYVSPEELNQLGRYISSVNSNTSLTKKQKDTILDRVYRQNYGEFEARAGSEYDPRTFPTMYSGKTW